MLWLILGGCAVLSFLVAMVSHWHGPALAPWWGVPHG
jgi:hypothetical protein